MTNINITKQLFLNEFRIYQISEMNYYDSKYNHQGFLKYFNDELVKFQKNIYNINKTQFMLITRHGTCNIIITYVEVNIYIYISKVKKKFIKLNDILLQIKH